MLFNNQQFTTVCGKIKDLIIRFGSIFIPASCIFCRQVISDEINMGVCPACYGCLPVWDKNDVPMPQLPKNVDSFDAPLLYETPVNKAITQMKFADKPEFARAFSRLMSEKVNSVMTDLTIVMPVPMHKKRLFFRQFNQAVLLAQGVCAPLTVTLDIFSLKRVKSTDPQLGKSAKARKNNLTSAFYVEPSTVQGKNIVLIDDVWTTGSTADACAKCLKRAGALRVDVVTICFVENSINGV